ncbi:type II secretion system protein M [Aggregicoccus sp. 17bor-14]|uniref:type II secretion system protein GspM n=1 Tax=Myxococcaceae TaxID=31 RepID=UPI00129CCDEB|nr:MULTISPECIES: type II secretion system protein GspM [Myxococcaceae]MBF5044900.1 type 4a pilus biogenesis protein PilO [Simulacricoccus sp. 17bor-14]MRI90644.1 type II secretion system protein M [Aggregicoccus sp. 17bor-14]
MDNLKEQLKALLANARAWFERLNAREQRMVGGLAAAFTVFLLFIILFSFSSSADGYRTRTKQKVAKLQEVQTLATSYREAEQARQQVEQQLTQSDVRLISYIEEKATAAGLEVPSFNPKPDVSLGDGRIVESSVELTFTDVDLREFTDFLKTVESGPGMVKVKNLRLDPRPGSDTLAASTTVATYKMKP